MTKILERIVGSNYLSDPERHTNSLFLLADDGFVYTLDNNFNSGILIRQHQRIREGLTFEELVTWEQYLHTGCWVETKSGKEKVFRSEQKAILSIEKDEAYWAPIKHYYFGKGERKSQYLSRSSTEYEPSMLRWAAKKAEQTGKDKLWVLKRGAVTSLEQPWKRKRCETLPYIETEAIAQMFSHRKAIYTEEDPSTTIKRQAEEENRKKGLQANTPYKITKSVGGEVFWQRGFRTGECPGDACTSGVPRWFCDIRDEDRLRVNSLTTSTHYLRSDGKFFHITGCLLYPEPLKNALSNDNAKIDEYLEEVYARGGGTPHGATYDIWECCEYIPDCDCNDLSNFWKVAAAARRTGRVFYTSKKKSLKRLLEGPEENIPWLYDNQLDQSTEEYNIRYKNRVEARAKQKAEDAKRIPKRIYFNFSDYVKHLSRVKEVDHAQILRVGPGASAEEIRAAYLKLAKQLHPDLNPGNRSAEEKFKQVAISYQTMMGG